MATIITKNSSTASSVPAAGSLQQGELAVNVTDKKLYTKDSSAAVVKLVGSLGNQEANAVAITGGTINGTAIGGTTPASAAFTTASASGGFTGNLTGNASTVTNGVYTTGSYADPAWITSLAGSKITGNISGNAANVTGTVAIANGGTGLTALGTGVQTALGQTVTGSGGIVLAASPSLTTPNLGTPSAVTLTNATGLPVSTGISGLGTNVATALGVSVGSVGSVVVNGGALGTPSSGTLTNATGLPLSTGVTGTLAVANGGTGITAFGSGVATALGVNVGSAGAFVVNGGALGTPSSGTVTNLTGTASININGTVGATTPNTGSFTTLTTSSTVTINGGTANGVAYLNGSKVLTTGVGLTFDGADLKLGLAGSFETVFSGEGLVLSKHNVGPKNALISAADNSSVLFLNNSAAGWDSVSMWASGSEQMRLTSTGLGIGTSSPDTKLTVSVADNSFAARFKSTNGVFRVLPFETGLGVKLTALNGNESAFEVLAYQAADHRFVTGVTERMRLDSSGNLGIGTSSPGQKLEVAGNILINTSGNPYAEIKTSGAGNNPYLKMTASTNSWTLQSTFSNTNDDLLFIYNSTTLLDLDNQGNLGLGVTPSAWGLDGVLELKAGRVIAFKGSGGVIASNAYYDTSWKYQSNSYAVKYDQQQNLGYHAWFTAPSGTAGNAISFTQAMTLDASGRLVVGATTAEARLQASAANPTDGVVTFFQNTSTSSQTGAKIKFDVGNVGTSGLGTPEGSTNALAFYVGGMTSASERARITSGGDLLVGTTDSGETTGVGFKFVASTTQPVSRLVINTATAAFTGITLYNTNATNNGYRFYVRADGGIGNYSGNNVNLSDSREKKDFAPAKSYLDAICAIPVQTFKYINQDSEEATLGVVAQDVQAVAPELVTESNWGTEDDPKMRLSIYQTDLQYALMKALQELKSELDTVKAELATLKGNP